MSDGRRTNGGARSGAGRKPAEARDELSRLMDKAIPVADRTAILAKLAQMALSGDIKAAQLVLAYLYGRPVERQEITGEAQGPLQIAVVYEDIQPLPDDE